MSIRAAGAPAASVFAGVSVTAVSLAGMLLPAQQRTASPADIPCSEAAQGASGSTQAAAGSPSGADYELCLSVDQIPTAPATPGSDLSYSIKVWVASLGSSTPATPPAIPATVTLQAGSGGGALHWVVCPGGVNGLDCSVAPMQPGPPGQTLKADLTIPASASGGQQVSFTVNATDPDSGASNVLASGPVSESVTVPTPSPSPSSTSPSPSPSSPSPSPSSSSPKPTPTGSHSRSPSASPTSSKKSGAGTKTGKGSGTGTGAGGTGTGGSSPISGVGASLPPGFTFTPVGSPAGSLGNLPGPVAGAGLPSAAFPKVTPEPSAAPSPVTLPGPQAARVANASAEFPLDGRLLGVQVGGLAVLGAAVTIAVARLSLRRRAPRHGK